MPLRTKVVREGLHFQVVRNRILPIQNVELNFDSHHDSVVKRWLIEYTNE
jgi:hypothetical protein